MQLQEIQAQIAKLPPEAVTKPILAALAEHLQSSSSDAAVLRQEVTSLRTPASPPHPYGPCNNPQCQSCVQAAQEAVLFGRQTFMGDLDAALAWANRRDIAEIVTDLYAEWERAGKPQPAKVGA